MKKEQAMPPCKLNLLLSFLSCEFDHYPFDEIKDSKYFGMLIRDFADLNLEEELKQYYAWSLDQPDRKKIYYRSRFRSWLKCAREFKTMKSRETERKVRGNHAQNRW